MIRSVSHSQMYGEFSCKAMLDRSFSSPPETMRIEQASKKRLAFSLLAKRVSKYRAAVSGFVVFLVVLPFCWRSETSSDVSTIMLKPEWNTRFIKDTIVSFCQLLSFVTLYRRLYILSVEKELTPSSAKSFEWDHHNVMFCTIIQYRYTL